MELYTSTRGNFLRSVFSIQLFSADCPKTLILFEQVDNDPAKPYFFGKIASSILIWQQSSGFRQGEKIMKKWILIGLGAIVVIAAIVVYVGLSNLGPIIKKAVNTYGPKITKTELHVADVGVSILSAEAKIEAFFLGNPKGFKSPSAMQVGSVFVNVDEKTLTGDTIIIERVEVKKPEIYYEKKGKTDNFSALLNNVKKSAASDKKSADTGKDEGGGKKFIINDFIITQGKVNLVMSVLGLGDKEIDVALPDIHLKDIGKKKGGASAAEVSKEIFAALHGKITSPAVTNALNQELKALGGSLDSVGKKSLKQVEEKTGKALEDAGKKVKGLLSD
jgi:uncharacterized protein involved in outer membrane biogenesis